MRLPLLFTLVVLFSCRSSAALPPGAPGDRCDFQVSWVEDSSGEGPERNRPYFSMGREKIAFANPSKVQVASSAGQLTVPLAARGLAAEVIFTNSELTPATDLAASLQTYFEAAQATIPTDADPASVQFVSSGNDRYRVNEYTCQSFLWSYTLLGKRTRREISYINITPKVQVRMVILSSEEDWTKAQAMARRFLTSWYVMSPEAKRFIK